METATVPTPVADGATEGETALPRARIISVVSPKGGAGKTTIATNLAVGLARRHPRQVVLVDLDLQFGDVASNLRLQPKSTMVDIARKWPVDSAQLKLALTAHHSGLYTLCAPRNPAEADEIDSAHVKGVLLSLHKSFRYVVADTDPGLTERVLSALDVSTDMLLMCSKEIPSIRGLRKAIEALDLIQLTGPRRWFVLNRADTRVGLEIEDVERTVGQTIDGRIPSSLDMVLAVNDGVPMIESGKHNDTVHALEQLVELFDERLDVAEAAKGGKGLFRRR